MAYRNPFANLFFVHPKTVFILKTVAIKCVQTVEHMNVARIL